MSSNDTLPRSMNQERHATMKPQSDVRPTFARVLTQRSFAALLAIALVAGCARSESEKKSAKPGIADAGIVVVQAEPVPLVIQLAGRTSAFEVSEVRPQVTGIVRERLFTEGSLVRAGQTLYRIDPEVYRATEAEARADLAKAQATLEAGRELAQRLRPLAEIEAVSRQEYTDAAARVRESEATIAQINARLEAAAINLRKTQIAAPIGGRIGRSLVTTGALVTANQTQALTTIFRLDPIFVDIQQSSADYLALRRALTKGDVASTAAQVSLTLEDGSVYTEPGTLLFAEAMVDPSTGSVTLRARFPNPSGLLLPGMYVRASLSQVTVRDAILVPQQAVARDPRGQATVMLVGPEDKAVARTVEAETTVGDKWLVRSGLVPGDRVIVEGLGRIRAGQKVRPVPIATSARNAETPPVPKPK